MSWRIVVISQRCKLDYSMNYMVVRGEETKRVFIDEIAVLMIENNAVSITGCLLSALIEKKVKVLFCDGKRNPQAELVSLYGAHNDSLKIRRQIDWDRQKKTEVWTEIVKEKIHNQAKLLKKAEKTAAADMLFRYVEEVYPGDITNREGHAAKVYFNALFGMKFRRGDESDPLNAALDYGYSLILSAFNREICLNGYLTQLGLGHENQFNHFNLSCDLMEPFRAIVDERVWNRKYKSFAKDEKIELVRLLTENFKIRNSEQTLLNAIRIYTKSVLDAVEEGNTELIAFVEI